MRWGRDEDRRWHAECPNCGSQLLDRDKIDKDGNERWRCKSCSHQWTEQS